LNKSGFIVVITAPSGSGKTTIYKKILSRRKDLAFSVSFTTRKPREGEQHGVDYFFVDTPTFEEKKNRGEFIEWARVHGKFYGTEKAQIENCINDGKICLLDIDVQGALRILEVFPDAVSIFIVPPSIEELERRLRKRGTENEEELRLRLLNARNELAYKKFFKYIVVNDKIRYAIEKIEKIIDQEKGRRNL